MNLLDAIEEQIKSAISPDTADSEPSSLMDVVSGLLANPQTGGLQGLISRFQEQGLGRLMDSWIGAGENLPISMEQLQSALGSEQVQSIAQQLGISKDAAASGLASMLPQVIDKLTPTGAVPDSGALGKGLELLTRLTA